MPAFCEGPTVRAAQKISATLPSTLHCAIVTTDGMVAAQWSAPDILAHARKSGGLAADERHRRTCVGCSRADVVGREAEIEQRRQVVPHCQLPHQQLSFGRAAHRGLRGSNVEECCVA